ncbi:hypothetical protein HNQ99_001776 [Rhizorhapis suberifaciens]|uniref:Uncharacterized protein n=1 Tax=Rhizorhapis suberifaciens TaxID=13656 RepID=A0A840HV50_9SPHN|nr:hypothetical protein [Rhizorhapis suberifaciens]
MLWNTHFTPSFSGRTFAAARSAWMRSSRTLAGSSAGSHHIAYNRRQHRDGGLAVKRTLARPHRNRRLAKHFEQIIATAAWLIAASDQLLVGRIARHCYLTK